MEKKGNKRKIKNILLIFLSVITTERVKPVFIDTRDRSK